MIQETINKIEATLKQARIADPKSKKKLIELLEQLKADLEREEKGSSFVSAARESLEEEARHFKASHPDLAEAVNDICTLLASIGI